MIIEPSGMNTVLCDMPLENKATSAKFEKTNFVEKSTGVPWGGRSFFRRLSIRDLQVDRRTNSRAKASSAGESPFLPPPGCTAADDNALRPIQEIDPDSEGWRDRRIPPECS